MLAALIVRMHVIDPKFRSLWKNYVAQAFLAGVGALLAMLVFKVADSAAVVVASMASTAFVVFSLPSRAVATPRHVIGGHSVGILVGVGVHFLEAQFPEVPIVGFYALSVTLAFFIMVVTDTDHAPAAGTAMGLVMLDAQPSLLLIASILGAASVFSVARVLLLKRLIDLR